MPDYADERRLFRLRLMFFATLSLSLRRWLPPRRRYHFITPPPFHAMLRRHAAIADIRVFFLIRRVFATCRRY
jgi:hypothetical protein